MRMIDCFSEAIARTLQHTEAIRGGETPDYETVSLDIKSALSEHARDYLAGGYSEDQYDTAKYAVLAFIDEALQSSSWEHKDRWKDKLLQTIHFQTVNAGEGFYERLSALSPVNPAEKDIREVYYYCLALGFRGRYFSPDDQTRLEEIRKRNLNLLTGGGEGLPASLEDGPLFPEAYVPGRTGTGTTARRNYHALYYGISVIVLLILFFVFRSQIIDAANHLVTTL